jgi:Ca2+-binding EF-hand superfamily protein
MQHDVVPYSAIERGIKAQQQEAVQLAASKEAILKEEDEKKKQEALQRQQIAEYAGLYEKLMASPEIQGILTEGKLLTGDDVRPGDAGFEFEVPPKGMHVDLLRQFLVAIGFEKLGQTEEFVGDPCSRWWDNELADSWQMLQDMLGVELRDGVVEKETLEQVLVMPAALLTLKARVEDELEHRANTAFGMILDSKESKDDEADLALGLTPFTKPTMEQLSQRLGITMARLDFLHKLFESYLEDENGNPCLDDAYPQDPKFLTKDVMKALMIEVRPDMGAAEFESRFKRIDVDGSGEIEFDEFIVWVREDEIKVVGGNKGKEGFEELAVKYDEHPEVLRRIYNYFKDALPEGVEDKFPDECVGMEKADVRKLFQDINPDMGDSEFEAQWQMIDMQGREEMTFPELLELVDFDILIDEITENLPVVE